MLQIVMNYRYTPVLIAGAMDPDRIVGLELENLTKSGRNMKTNAVELDRDSGHSPERFPLRYQRVRRDRRLNRNGVR